MIHLSLHIIIIALLVSIATVLPGIFLVLRGMALMSDAISHAILPGIVIMFFIVKKLESPFLLFGAAVAGLCTVLLTQMVIQTKRVYKDAAIGLIFPLFFSIGVLLISKYARHVHLDTDMALLGEIAFAPFHPLIFYGYNIGSYALWTMLCIALINSICITIFFKEFVINTFDESFAHMMGFSPLFFHYLLMIMTSITTVAAFDIVGSLVVVALIITPAATAYLVSYTMHEMFFNGIITSASCVCVGYTVAYCTNVSIAGALAGTNGIFFLATLLFSHRKGIIAVYLQRKKEYRTLAHTILCAYLAKKNRVTVSEIMYDLNWSEQFTTKIIQLCEKNMPIADKIERSSLQK